MLRLEIADDALEPRCDWRILAPRDPGAGFRSYFCLDDLFNQLFFGEMCQSRFLEFIVVPYREMKHLLDNGWCKI